MKWLRDPVFYVTEKFTVENYLRVVFEEESLKIFIRKHKTKFLPKTLKGSDILRIILFIK